MFGQLDEQGCVSVRHQVWKGSGLTSDLSTSAFSALPPPLSQLAASPNYLPTS